MLNGLGRNFLVSPSAIPTTTSPHLARTGRWVTWLREARGNHRVYVRTFRHLVHHSMLGPLKRILLHHAPAPITPGAHVWLLNPDLRARTAIKASL